MFFQKKNRPVIGLADISVNGFALVRTLRERYPWADIVYVNDPESLPFEGRKPEEIEAVITRILNRLLAHKPACILVTSDLLAEHGEAVFSRAPVPVIWTARIADELLRTRYEQKNILLIARAETLAANLYQKGLKYNRLYTIPADALEDLVASTAVKTEESFTACEKVLLPVKGKEVDVVLATPPSLAQLSIEIGEFVKNAEGFAAEFPDIASLSAEALSTYVTRFRGKGQTTVISSLKEDEFKRLTMRLGSYDDYGKEKA